MLASSVESCVTFGDTGKLEMKSFAGWQLFVNRKQVIAFTQREWIFNCKDIIPIKILYVLLFLLH